MRKTRLLVMVLICGGAIPLSADSSIPHFDFVVDTARAGVPPAGPAGPAGANPGAPAHQGVAPVYGVGAGGGVWVSLDGGSTWIDRSAGLPVRVVYPFDGSLFRRVESFAYDPLDPARVAVAIADGVCVSRDAGATWREVSIGDPVTSVDHITAVCLRPQDAQTIYIGTSFSGYFKTTDGGKSWRSENSVIKHLYLGAGFYESITAIAVSPVDEGRMYLAVGTGGEILESADGGHSWQSIGFPAGMVYAMSVVYDGAAGSWSPRVYGHGGVYAYAAGTGSWAPDSAAVPAKPNPHVPAAKKSRLKVASDRTGIYVNSGRASGEGLEEHLGLVTEHGMNTIVVDVKDDFGRVTYDSGLNLPREVGAVSVRFDLDDLLARAHEAGIYVVGRIVVFQDPKLYAYNDHAYAVWNRNTDEPWGNLLAVPGPDGEVTGYEQREYWVDPYSEFVWRYNIGIANEITARGIDEVQFDYIRFPSDGDTSLIQYRFKREGMTRVDAIESFLTLAREQIDVPMSTDLYGFNAWYLMGGWIGQNLDMIADYVDVVCPMFYPSHFPGAFLSGLGFFDRAEAIYRTGSNRAASFVGERSVVRPYVQAFLIGAERRFETDAYTLYLARQLEGVVSSGASGFTLWNASNVYYMVTESLKRFTTDTGAR